jgi:hypothetical protein
MVPSNNIKPYETDYSTMWFDEEGIFHSVTKKERVVDIDVLKSTFEYISKNKKSEKICWIGDVSNASPVEKEARAYAAQETPKFIKALAVITNSSMSKMMADLFLLVYKPSFPIKLFTDQEEATKWIKGFL